MGEMRCARIGTWFYTVYDQSQSHHNPWGLIKITNNMGEARRLTSISIKLGTGSGTVTTTGGNQTFQGQPYDVYLTFDGNNSDTHTVSKIVNNTAGSGNNRYYLLSQMTDDYYVVFNFPGKPVVANGTTITVDFRKSNRGGYTGKTLLVAPPSPNDDVYQRNGNSPIYCATEGLYDPPSGYENSLSISPDIGVYGVTSYTFSYNITRGSNDLEWVHLDTYHDNSGNLAGWRAVGTGFGNRSDGMVFGSDGGDTGYAGGKFQGQVSFNDYNTRYATNKADFYTYTYPTLWLSTPSGAFSPQDSKKFNWTSNIAKWKGISKESDLTTILKINGKTVSGISQLPTYSNNTNPPEIDLANYLSNTYYDNNAKSVAQMTGTVTVERENTSAKGRNNNNRYYVSQSKNYTVQYQPTQSPTNGTASYSGQTIVVQDVPSITATWSYPSSAGAAGVVNGYYVEIYSDSNLTKKVGNTITVSSGSVNINTKTQLKRGVLNYAKIIPFYTKPNGSGNISGTKYAKITLVKPVSRLNSPTIDYPKNNTTWLNKNFRILFQLPLDDDLSQLISDGTISNQAAYRYQDIKVEVKYGSTTKTYTWKNNKSYFSTNTLSYQKKVAVHPGADSSLANADSYTVNIYVQKNYYQTTGDGSWSKATSVTINRSAISKYTFIAGETKVLASHYKTIRDKSIEMRNAYPIKTLDSRNITRVKGDIIGYSEYAGVYQTVKDIQTGINEYCTYDNIDVSLKTTIKDLTDNPPKKEIITAANTDTSKGGRNYVNIIIDDMNILK